MSGICGEARCDAAIDGNALERMTTALVSCGPDGKGTWRGSGIGLGHTLLRTRERMVGEEQPYTDDGRSWIVADARIDARDELRRALEAQGRPVLVQAGDAELILAAYHAWGRGCTERLLGDYSFALWDGERHALFCARDPVGARPFFYASEGAGLVFSNSLRALRAHPRVGSALDELAIADFLLFEASQEPSATAFASIRRLPPAHWLEFSTDGLLVRRFWQLAGPEVPSYRRESEYVEHFDAILDAAVADRLGTPDVAVFMSGGLDSTAIAAAAKRRGARVHAFTTVYDHIIPDEERRYSAVAAKALGIPVSHRACDGYGLFDRYQEMRRFFPEPANAPFAAIDVDLAADAGRHARVALSGWDGDTLLSESPRPYFRSLAAQRRWGTLMLAGTRFFTLNPAGALRSIASRAVVRPRPGPAQRAWPAWLSEDLASRLRLRERWRHVTEPAAMPAHPLRPHAHAVFDWLARLATFFEDGHASRTGVALEMRHPFMDLRVIEYCLSLPPVPWCVRKEILRRWSQGLLPEEVRRRPKTPLAGFPHMAVLDRPDSRWIRDLHMCTEASAFIDQGKISFMQPHADAATSWTQLRPAALDLWLRHARAA